MTPDGVKHITSYQYDIIMKNKSYKAYGIINSTLRMEPTIRQIQDCYNYGRKKTNHVDFLTACGYRNAR